MSNGYDGIRHLNSHVVGSLPTYLHSEGFCMHIIISVPSQDTLSSLININLNDIIDLPRCLQIIEKFSVSHIPQWAKEGGKLHPEKVILDWHEYELQHCHDLVPDLRRDLRQSSSVTQTPPLYEIRGHWISINFRM